MGENLTIELRRFDPTVLPFLYILVTGEMRGNAKNAYDFFQNALNHVEELPNIATRQVARNTERLPNCCAYLVNFHDFVDATLHVNMRTVGRETATGAITKNFLEVRRLLTHLESGATVDINELVSKFKNSSEIYGCSLETLVACLHVYFSHLLILNIELCKAINAIIRNSSNSAKFSNMRVLIAPELPIYLVQVLYPLSEYQSFDTTLISDDEARSAFGRETNIVYSTLEAVPWLDIIKPIWSAYVGTLPRNSNCRAILMSEIWCREEYNEQFSRKISSD